MRPPLAGRRAAARRLAEDVRRRLEPIERVLPVRLPGYERPAAGPAEPAPAGPGPVAPVSPVEPTPEQLAARIDAARERLRATIEPPPPDDGERESAR